MSFMSFEPAGDKGTGLWKLIFKLPILFFFAVNCNMQIPYRKSGLSRPSPLWVWRSACPAVTVRAGTGNRTVGRVVCQDIARTADGTTLRADYFLNTNSRSAATRINRNMSVLLYNMERRRLLPKTVAYIKPTLPGGIVLFLCVLPS